MDWEPIMNAGRVGAMTTSEWVLSVLTGVLVLATIYYAWQTQQMVREMRKAREVQVRPKVVLGIRVLGPNDFYPRIMNVGAGPALDLSAEVTLEPNGPSGDYSTVFMAPGRDAGIILNDGSGRITDIDRYRPFATLRMKGRCSDVYGMTFKFDEVFDLKSYMQGFKSGTWARFPRIEKSGEPLDLIADALVNIENLFRMDRESS